MALILVTACSQAGGSTGSSPPAGSSSSASSAASSSSSGAASVDTRADAGVAPPVTCVNPNALDIWQPVAADLQLPRDKGRVLGCVFQGSYSAAELGATPYVDGQGWTAQNGGDAYVIQYVSEGPPGVARRVTAQVAMPTGVAGPVPLVAVAHGTSGMGPSCGITRMPDYADYMVVPLVAMGFATVTTDYVGLGVEEGLHPYLVGEAEAFNVLDSVRAVHALQQQAALGSTTLDGDLFILGHSQGGHAALFAHGMDDGTTGFNLLGSVAFAPGLGSLGGADTFFRDGRATDVVTTYVMMVLAGTATYHGRHDFSSWLSPTAAAQIPGLLHDQCVESLFARVPQRWPDQGDLYNDAFQAAAAACDFSSETCPSFEPWYTELRAALPGAFASGAPVLLMQGLADDVVSAEGTRCVQERLLSHGTDVQACALVGTDHNDVVFDGMPAALDWMNARRTGSGATPNVCQRALTVPCQ